MNPAELQNKLIAAARLRAADDRVPYAFEKRILAHIAARPAVDQWLAWSRGLWRAAGACVAVAVMLAAISIFAPAAAADKGNDLSQDFENTLLASVDQSDATAP